MSIDKKYDPIIKLLYQISKEKFENECQVEEEKLGVIQDLCFKAKKNSKKNLLQLKKQNLFQKQFNMQRMEKNFLLGKNKSLVDELER